MSKIIIRIEAGTHVVDLEDWQCDCCDPMSESEIENAIQEVALDRLQWSWHYAD